jgi:hypothetical protein
MYLYHEIISAEFNRVGDWRKAPLGFVPVDAKK